MRAYSWRHAAIAVVLAGAALPGCMHAQARVNPEQQPPLDIPAPPPRNVEAAEPEPPLPATATGEPSRAPTTRPRPPQPAAQQRAEPARPEPPKVEPVSATPAEPPRPADDARAPTPSTLQTTPPEREAQVERNILDSLARASANLNRVDYRVLNADARTQYDQAKRFISQARDALRDKNLVFANNLADKALTLAAQLAGR